MSRRNLVGITLFVTVMALAVFGFNGPLLSATKKTSKPVYKVYAISYGVIADFPVAGLVQGADKSRKMDIQMMIWLLKGSDGRNILVDTGFYRQKFFKHWKIRDYIKPSEAIDKVGLKPNQISDIILTHIHWDHADGVDLFPNAQIWIQKDEFNYYCNPAKQEKEIDPDDKAILIKLRNEGRVHFVNGDDQEIFPGVIAYTGGKHTYASQYLGVRTKEGTVIVASDNVYLYENLEKHAPIAETLDAASNLKAQDRMLKLAASPRLIVPGHDPAVFKRFPKPGNGVALIK